MTLLEKNETAGPGCCCVAFLPTALLPAARAGGHPLASRPYCASRTRNVCELTAPARPSARLTPIVDSAHFSWHSVNNGEQAPDTDFPGHQPANLPTLAYQLPLEMFPADLEPGPGPGLGS